MELQFCLITEKKSWQNRLSNKTKCSKVVLETLHIFQMIYLKVTFGIADLLNSSMAKATPPALFLNDPIGVTQPTLITVLLLSSAGITATCSALTKCIAQNTKSNIIIFGITVILKKKTQEANTTYFFFFLKFVCF